MSDLPKLTLAKFTAASRELERMAKEQQATFVTAQAEYLATHREGTTRPLNANEAAQVAAAMASDLDVGQFGTAAASVQASDLRAYDDPQPQEVLLAAGAATAGAFLQLAKRFTVLVEMPLDVFETAYEDDALDAAITAAVAELDGEDLADARLRASAALRHFGEKSGVAEGKLVALLGKTVLGAAIEALRQSGLTGSTSSSLIDSAASTAAGADATSSTD